METVAIATDAATAAREKLHRFIDTIEDARAISLYEVCKPEMEDENNFTYTDEFIAELEEIEKEDKWVSEENFWEDIRKHINTKR